MNLKEFTSEICKNTSKKNFKVRGSYGVYDVYKALRKQGWSLIGKAVKEHEFYSIIRNVNRLLAKELSEGNTVIFPSRMGKLELRKYTPGVSIIDGKLKIGYPIDWHETIKLWFEDEEAKNKKTLLRREHSDIYRIKYCKHSANYENKSFYEFTLNRFIKKALKENIEQGKIDALW